MRPMDFMGDAIETVSAEADGDEASFAPRPVVDPHVLRCGNAMRRAGLEIAPHALAEIVAGDPILRARMLAYPRTGTLDGMDTCDRDRLMSCVARRYLREGWPEASSGRAVLRSFLGRLVAALTAQGAWA